MKVLSVVLGLVLIILLANSVQAVKYDIVPCSWEEKQLSRDQQVENGFVCVVRGDWISKIYKKYAENSWDSLNKFATVNLIPTSDMDHIYVGQKIVITKGAAESLKKTQRVSLGYDDYTVREGDSLWTIWIRENLWSKYGVPFSEFFEKNKDALLDQNNLNYLKPGHTIMIPKESVATPPKTPPSNKLVLDGANVVTSSTESELEDMLKSFYNKYKVVVILETVGEVENKEKLDEMMASRFTDSKTGLDSTNSLNTLVFYVKRLREERDRVYFYGYYGKEGGLPDTVADYVMKARHEDYSKKSDGEFLAFVIDEILGVIESKINEPIVKKDDAKKLFDEGYELYKKGTSFYDGAKEVFEDLNEKYPSSEYSARAWLLRGKIEYQLGKKVNAGYAYMRLYNDYKDLYPKWAEEGLYNRIWLWSNGDGNCKNIRESWIEYKNAQYKKYLEEIQEFVDKCNEKDAKLNEKCKIIGDLKSGYKTIDVVFIVEAGSDLNMIKNHAEKAKERFLDADIIKGNEKYFNFYWVNEMGMGICEVGENSRNCDKNKIKSLAENCPYDTVVLFSYSNFQSHAIWEGQSYVSIPGARDIYDTALHEFGHSFGGLADEYTLDGEGDHPRKPNCVDDVSEAALTWGSLYEKGVVEYFEGCSYVKSNRRPTEKGIMRCDYDLEPPYFGPVNDRHLQVEINKIVRVA
jgi:TolA-binding protein